MGFDVLRVGEVLEHGGVAGDLMDEGFEIAEGVLAVEEVLLVEEVGVFDGEKCALEVQTGYDYNNLCCLYTNNCRYSSYMDSCEGCQYCFGCVGLRKKQYCVLNKQYTKEEYESLVEKIKGNMKERGEWGNFFPLSSAYCGYIFL